MTILNSQFLCKILDHSQIPLLINHGFGDSFTIPFLRKNSCPSVLNFDNLQERFPSSLICIECERIKNA